MLCVGGDGAPQQHRCARACLAQFVSVPKRHGGVAHAVITGEGDGEDDHGCLRPFGSVRESCGHGRGGVVAGHQTTFDVDPVGSQRD